LVDPTSGEERLAQVLDQAGMLEWVHGLPQGLETWIGERGVQMSGGERQRLAVARCLLQDAPILLLDEPTANLDAVAEERLLATLPVVMHGRTVLWITHRLVGLETMDEIIVLADGRITQRGTHAELIRTTGLYQRMWTLQNRIILDPPGTSGSSAAF
jgi:ATP-binding cassette, subfamily C, bacterial CydC